MKQVENKEQNGRFECKEKINSKSVREKLVGYLPLQIHCVHFSTLLFALGLTCMEYVSGFFTFWLLVGFSQCRSPARHLP